MGALVRSSGQWRPSSMLARCVMFLPSPNAHQMSINYPWVASGFRAIHLLAICQLPVCHAPVSSSLQDSLLVVGIIPH